MTPSDILDDLTPEQIAIVESTMRDDIRAKRKSYYQTRRDEILPARRAWYRAHLDELKTASRRYHLKKRYRLAVSVFEDLKAKQDHACAVCGVSLLDLLPKQVHVDHDHLTGKVRGIVCRGCNIKIAAVESPLFPRVMAYIARTV